MIGKCEVFLQVQEHASMGTGTYTDLSNGTLRMGVSSRKRAACCGGTTVMPEGLCRGPARRAANLPSAMPNDMLKPNSCFTAALMLPTTCTDRSRYLHTPCKQTVVGVHTEPAVAHNCLVKNGVFGMTLPGRGHAEG